jgi:uncharacterized membrane protein YqaE (UPF0057 family)
MALLLLLFQYYIHQTKPTLMKNLRLLLPGIVFVLFINPYSYASLPASSPHNDDPAALIVSGIKEFKSLPRSERKAKLREIRKILKEHRANKMAGKESDDQILAIIFAILIPPLGVYLYEKKITTKFWISLLLTLLFWLPGAIYALLVVTGNA